LQIVMCIFLLNCRRASIIQAEKNRDTTEIWSTDHFQFLTLYSKHQWCPKCDTAEDVQIFPNLDYTDDFELVFGEATGANCDKVCF
jgi:hypothetical protein